MKKIYSLFFLSLIASPLFAQTFVKWDFDGSNTVPSLDNTTGTAAISAVGTTASFVQGNPSTGMGWNTTSYPTQGTGSGTRGLQFGASTSGRSGLIFGFDIRLSNTASKYYVVKYTTDGTNWNNFDITALNTTTPTGGVDASNDLLSIPLGTIWYSYTIDMSTIPAANNNPNFAIQILASFDPATGSSYTGVASAYGTSGTTRFDNIQLGQNGTLPIKLSYFTANATKDNRVAIGWETETETNFKHFIVEKSTDGASFTSINTVPAIGSGSSYQYTDNNPSGKQIFYRLKIVNLDNSFEYSTIARVDMRAVLNNEFNIVPNPVNDVLNLEFAKPESGMVYVYDLSGKVVVAETMNGTENEKTIDVSKLPKGLYTVSFRMGDIKTSHNFSKL